MNSDSKNNKKIYNLKSIARELNKSESNLKEIYTTDYTISTVKRRNTAI